MRGVLVAIGFGLVFGVYIIPMVTHAFIDTDAIRDRVHMRLDEARQRVEDRLGAARERQEARRERLCERFAARPFGPSFCEEEGSDDDSGDGDDAGGDDGDTGDDTEGDDGDDTGDGDGTGGGDDGSGDDGAGDGSDDGDGTGDDGSDDGDTGDGSGDGDDAGDGSDDGDGSGDGDTGDDGSGEDSDTGDAGAGDGSGDDDTGGDDTPTGTRGVLLSEVLYDVDSATQGAESANEWVEIYNGTDVEQDLTGWQLEDASGSSDAIPAAVVPAGGFLVVANATDTLTFWTFPEGAVVVALESSIGNGLGNSGDALFLSMPDGTQVDTVGWEGDESAFGVASSLSAPEGSSLVRDLSTPDTDTEADWSAQEAPDPGESSTATGTDDGGDTGDGDSGGNEGDGGDGSSDGDGDGSGDGDTGDGGGDAGTSASPLVLTELYYDTDTDHGTDADNEWVELYNTSDEPYEMTGYYLEDANGTQDLVPTSTIPAETYAVIADATTTADFWSIPAGAVVIFLESNIGNGLGNTGDALYLKNARDETIDAVSYGNNTDVFDPAAPDVADGNALARDPSVNPASAGDWTERDTPTPGGPAVPNTSGGSEV